MTRRTIFCKHFRSMGANDTCNAGVEYATFRDLPHGRKPCFCRNGESPPGGCELAVFPTAEEIAAEDAEHAKIIIESMLARDAIVAHCGGPWKRGMPSASGAIDCPICSGIGTLRYSRAGVNGHIHAACATDNCVAWME